MKANVVIGLVICGPILLIMLFIMYGLWMYPKKMKQKYEICTSRTIGTVKSIRVAGKGNGPHPSVYPTITYTTARGEVISSNEGVKGDGTPYKVGDTVTVFYDPQNPKNHYLSNDPMPEEASKTGLAIVIMCLIFTVITLLLCFFAW